MGKLAPFLSSLRFLSSLSLLTLVTYLGITPPFELRAGAQTSSPCSSVFSRLRSHQVSSGDTLESIANRYGLVGQTLFSFNSNLQRGLPAIGVANIHHYLSALKYHPTYLITVESLHLLSGG